MSAAADTERGGWQFDRRVPLMLLVMLGVQVGTALLWAGGVNERISTLEAAVTMQADMLERTARLEEQLRHALLALDRIEKKLERMKEE